MEIKILKIQIQKIKIGEIVHFEVTDVIRTFKYCNFSSLYHETTIPKVYFNQIFFFKNQS